jgi:hypothetical protein
MATSMHSNPINRTPDSLATLTTAEKPAPPACGRLAGNHAKYNDLRLFESLAEKSIRQPGYRFTLKWVCESALGFASRPCDRFALIEDEEAMQAY